MDTPIEPTYGRSWKRIAAIALLVWLSSAALFYAQDTAIRVESKTLEAGSSSTLDVRVFGLPGSGVSDVQGNMQFDPSVIRVTGISALSEYTLFASDTDNDNGRVQFALAMVDGSPIRQGGLLRLDVDAVGQSGDSTDVTLNLDAFRGPDGNELLGGEELESALASGSVDIGQNGNGNGDGDGGTTPGPVSIHVYPNPATSQANFVYELPEETNQAQLWVANVRGRTVFQQDIGAGSNEFTWNLENNAGQPVPEGAYVYRVIAQTPNGASSSPVGKLVIQR